MARFPRPAGAIEDVMEIKNGDVLYRVYGIWPPVVSRDAYIVVGNPHKFKHNIEFSEHSSQGEEVVFSTCYGDEKNSRFNAWNNFAGDGNLVKGHSHNDNYWFRSREEAEAARAYLHAQYEAHPEAIEDEKRLKEYMRDLDHEYETRWDSPND